MMLAKKFVWEIWDQENFLGNKYLIYFFNVLINILKMIIYIDVFNNLKGIRK